MRVAAVETPHTVEEALAALGANACTRVVAGGTALVPSMRAEPVRPDLRLVWVGGISALQRIEVTDEAVLLGAGVRLAGLERDARILQRVPGLAGCLSALATGRIRAMATVGGALAQGDAGYDLPVLLCALGARVRLVGPAGESEMPVERLIDAGPSSDVGTRSLLTDVVIPVAAGDRAAFLKLSPRTGTDRAVVSAAVSLGITHESQVVAARVVLGGLGPRLVVAHEAARLLLGARPADVAGRAPALGAAVAAAVAAAGEPPSDVRGSSAYRSAMAPVVVRRCALLAARP